MGDKANPLGTYLKERRARLDPEAFGFSMSRRRTPGLRREEVAQLAHVSATWYTWLEQGRGGAPSADVLDRLARTFALDDAEREHMFLLAQERPPKVRPKEPARVTPQLQRVLDSFADTPAIVKTPDWTVVAWNRAASAVLVDYAQLPERERNVLRLMFGRRDKDRMPDWEAVARAVVATMRRDVLRAGMQSQTEALVEDLSAQSEEFRQMWAEHDVRAHGEGVKSIRHPVAGRLDLEFSTFAVDARPDLAMVVFNPATDEDRLKIRQLIAC
ncbi:helix-turn-helix transcriptional regulator [Oricola sp.]|uniref:helix-turn-helix transcriptional regulator n=1 Tax=Oricola sp. TaxID=1979950 RepID=UPI0025D92E82|nr:helix-turn-helix transcriptional regulator [Oricola sp.]MCI5076332.1 helix-turn-helix transcriptional regulator [Oricola sp.]